jgi:hypothetical protein
MAAGLGFKTFTTGEVLTAADTNGYLMQGVLVFASAAARDAAITSPQEGQFAYLKDTNVTTYYTGSAWANLDTTGMTNPMTTTGDTIYSSSGSTPARLGIGSTGQVLTVSGGIPSWATPAAGSTLVGCSLWNNVNLTVSNNTMTSVTYNSENYDTDGFHSTSTNTNRITIPTGKGGKYEISACIQWDNSVTGLRQAFLFKNGGGWLDLYGPQSSASRSTYFLYTIEDLSPGDYLSLEILQSCGGLLTAYFNGTKNYFTVNYLGA